MASISIKEDNKSPYEKIITKPTPSKTEHLINILGVLDILQRAIY
jgi:hypothetical protein